MIISFFPSPFGSEPWDLRGNQHIRKLGKHLRETSGNQVNGLSPKQLLSLIFPANTQTDLLIINWPDYFIISLCEHYITKIFKRTFGLRISLKLISIVVKAWFLFFKKSVSIKNMKLAWFIHEVRLHTTDDFKISVDRLVRQCLFNIVDSILITENSTLPVIEDAFGSAATKNIFLSPIGDYSEVHGEAIPKMEAKSKFNIDCNSRVILHFGTRRENRNEEDLINAFANYENENLKLIVAGQGYTQTTYRNVRFFSGLLSNEMVRDLVCASDFVINPAPLYLNSGALRCAISYSRCVVGYNFGSVVDMANDCLVDLSHFTNYSELLSHLESISQDQINAYERVALLRNSERGWSKSYEGLDKLLKHSQF